MLGKSGANGIFQSVWYSDDLGRSWSQSRVAQGGTITFDRIQQLGNGALIASSALADKVVHHVFTCSSDGGGSWGSC
jgi:hypothetical protein